MSKSIDLEKWEKLLQLGLDYRRERCLGKNWALYRKMRRGHFGLIEGYTPTLTYNLTYANGKVIVTSVYYRNPYFMCSPRGGYGRDSEIKAKVQEAYLNYLVDAINLKQTMRDAAQDAYECGTGVIKLGFDSEFGTPSSTEEHADDGGELQLNRKGTEYIEWNGNVHAGMPWALRIDPEQIITPYGIRAPEDFDWIDHVYFRPLDDVKGSSLYKLPADFSGTHIASSKFFEYRQAEMDELSTLGQYVELHEIRDRRTREVFVYAPYGSEKKAIIRKEDSDVLQDQYGLPFVFLQWNRDSERFWCSSDVALIEAQQHEMNESRTQSMEHRRRALTKILAREGVFTPEELAKFTSGTVGAVAKHNSPNVASDIMQLTPYIPPDTVQWVDKIKEDVREILGIGRNQMGDMDRSSRKTATEVEVVNSANQLRMSDRQDAMRDVVREVGKKLLCIGRRFTSTSRIIQVVGYDAATYMVEVDKDALSGDYDVRVDADSMTPNTKRMRRQEIIQLIQAVGNNPRANVDYLMRMLLREFDWVDAMKVLPEAAPMPGMEQLAGQAMPMAAFEQSQQRMLANPGMMQGRVKANSERLGSGVSR